MRTTKRCAADNAGPREAARGFLGFATFRAICPFAGAPRPNPVRLVRLGRRIKFGPNPAKNEALGGPGGATTGKMDRRRRKGALGGLRGGTAGVALRTRSPGVVFYSSGGHLYSTYCF